MWSRRRRQSDSDAVHGLDERFVQRLGGAFMPCRLVAQGLEEGALGPRLGGSGGSFDQRSMWTECP
ncbi:hypothetical protein [Streptomyces sp. NPDC096311]|uniref:hypothetical protein n=1 Tax=Streptomyces sp. NPDC096311 TaxID=3366083 RepID=UPI0038182AE0